MAMIRVQYDAYNRHFTMVDRQGARLRDGETYLVMDIPADDFESPLAYEDGGELYDLLRGMLRLRPRQNRELPAEDAIPLAPETIEFDGMDVHVLRCTIPSLTR